MAFVFGFQTLSLTEFTKIFQLKGLKPKNKGHANFYEFCDLMKKVFVYLNKIFVKYVQLEWGPEIENN